MALKLGKDDVAGRPKPAAEKDPKIPGERKPPKKGGKKGQGK